MTMNIVTPQHEILLQGASQYVIRFSQYSTGAHLYFWAERKCDNKQHYANVKSATDGHLLVHALVSIFWPTDDQLTGNSLL